MGTMKQRLEFIMPVNFFGTPRVYEKMADKLKQAVNLMPNIFWLRDIFDYLRSKKLERQINLMHGGTGAYPFAYMSANAMTRYFRSAMGLHKTTSLISGAAPLSYDTWALLASFGFEVVQGYGLTESALVASLCTMNRQVPGSVGCVVDGLEGAILRKDDHLS